ncbi:hypothetical protein BDZ97DRAFT_1772299 [Flammula alnicola]|nr:hypothetical protein BDZ97DRAFT_1772299 [Flammula alnicola]
MGERHQPDKPNYRCIGALHISAITRFLKLMKLKDHAEIIREEVLELKAPVIPAIPCPFTSFLLSSAWSTDLSNPEDMYGSNTSYLPTELGTLDADNNDGITVIDEYVRTYYPETKDMEEVALNAIKGSHTQAQKNWLQEQIVMSILPAFDSIPLISIHKLAEAWPRFAPEETVIEVINESELPSLTDLALPPALELALRNGDNGDNEKFEQLLFLPDKARKIRDILRAQSPMPDAEVKHDKFIDLSGFHLTGEQVIAVLPQDGDVEILKLSHNDQVKIDTVEKVLTMYPSLRRLVLLKTGVTDDDVVALLKDKPKLFHRMEAFIHPAFMKGPDVSKIPSAFTFVSLQDFYFDGVPTSISLPYFTTGQIAQALTDFLGPLAAKNPYQFIDSVISGFPSRALMAACASQLRREGQPWGERLVSIVPNLAYAMMALPERQAWNFVLRDNLGEFLYGFVRCNSEAFDQYAKECEEVRSHMKDAENPLTQEEVDTKLEALGEAYTSRLYDIYDARDFFRQLELEGREPPAPEMLAQLSDIFSTLGSKKKGDYGFMQLITARELLVYIQTPLFLDM